MESEIKVCIVCLKTSCRVYSIHALGLAEAYNALLSGCPTSAGNLPQSVCCICATQVRKVGHLAATCKQSQILLCDVLVAVQKEERQLTLKDIEKITSDIATFPSSTFTFTHFTSNHGNLHINEENFKSANTLRLAETDSDDSSGATGNVQCIMVQDKEPVNLVDGIKTENCNAEKCHMMFDDIKSEEKNSFVTNNMSKNEVCLDSCMNNDLTYKSEECDNLNVGDEKGRIENVVLKVEPVFIDDGNRPTKITKDSNKGNKSKSKTLKEYTTKEKKKPVLKEKKKTKKQKWKEGKDAKEKLLSEHFNIKKLNLEEQRAELEKTKIKANYVKSPYKCDSCYKGFKTESNYTAHMVKHSESSGSHKCEVCHLFFKAREAHCTHMLRHRCLYTCNACPHQTQSKHQALLHINWHRGTVYKCDQCTDAVFEFETSLHRHRRIHHPSPISCQLCGVGCKDDKGLRMHYEWKHVGVSVSV